jgi:hypothetical protein
MVEVNIVHFHEKKKTDALYQSNSFFFSFHHVLFLYPFWLVETLAFHGEAMTVLSDTRST